MDPVETFLQNLEENKRREAQATDPSQEFVKEQFSNVVSELSRAAKRIEDAVATLGKIEVKNPVKSVSTPDITKATEAIKAIKIPETDMKPTEKRLDDLTRAVGAIPETKTVEVSNIDPKMTEKLSKDLAAINQTLDKLEMSPKITVKPASVSVEKTDLGPLEKGLKAIKKAVDDKPLPGIPNVPTDPLIYYLAADEDDSGGDTGVNYYGYTDNKGAWYVRKYDRSVSPHTIRLAFGQTNYSTNWTNRASLTYSIWGS